MPTATQPGTTPTSAPHVSRFIGTRDLIPNPACPTCGSKRTVKKGKRHNRMRTLQVYECVECLHRFTSGDAGKNKTYPLKIILEAVSTFNLGYSMTETQRQLRRRFHVDVPERSISSWISEHRPLVTYRRLRDTAKKLFSPERLLRTVELDHQQVYRFQVHQAKLELLLNYAPLQELTDYFASVENQFPHELFQESRQRSSTFPIELHPPVARKGRSKQLLPMGKKYCATAIPVVGLDCQSFFDVKTLQTSTTSQHGITFVADNCGRVAMDSPLTHWRTFQLGSRSVG